MKCLPEPPQFATDSSSPLGHCGFPSQKQALVVPSSQSRGVSSVKHCSLVEGVVVGAGVVLAPPGVDSGWGGGMKVVEVTIGWK